MEDDPFTAWLDLMLLPIRMQAAVTSDLISAGGNFSGSFISATNGSRRSRANLRLVSCNNWIKPARSKAALKLVAA